MMQLKRKVVLSTLGAMLIASIFICSWFRPEAVKERNLDFLKHEAAEFIREQSADNIFSYEKFESGEYRTYTCNINDVYISGPILSIVEKNNELLDGGISWVVSVNGEIIGTIEQDAALYSVSLSSQDFDQYILYGTAYILQAISSRKLPAVSPTMNTIQKVEEPFCLIIYLRHLITSQENMVLLKQPANFLLPVH